MSYILVFVFLQQKKICIFVMLQEKNYIIDCRMKEQIDMLQFEKEYISQGKKLVAGIDEAGRGPLAGPVYACAIIMKEDNVIAEVNDSKKLSEKKNSRSQRSRQKQNHQCPPHTPIIREADAAGTSSVWHRPRVYVSMDDFSAPS